MEEAEALIRSVFQNDQNQPTATLMPRVRTKDLVDELERVMSTTDWQRILKGTSTTFCTAGSVIIEEGTTRDNFYFMTYGFEQERSILPYIRLYMGFVQYRKKLLRRMELRG